jgi:RNA polymerase sigma factor (sigma-70 family)
MNEREILSKWDRYVWGIVMKFPLHDPLLTPEDLHSAGALALLEAHASWDPKGGASLKAWIGRKVTWAIKDLLRRETHSRNRGRVECEPLEEEPLAPLPACELSVLALPYVEDALLTLPPSHARALRARYFEGLTLAEAGSRRGVSRQAESNVVQDALRRMRVRFGIVGDA